MFLQLNHKNLEAYKVSRELLIACYDISKSLPSDERYNLTQQIRRAALSVKLNIAEGSSRKSETERKRYYEIARGSIIEIDAAIESAFDLDYTTKEKIEPLSKILNKSFSLLSGLLK